MKKVILLLVSLVCFSTHADDIGLGQVIAIKQYDFSNNKIIKIYLSSNSQYQNPSCLENGRPAGKLTHSLHEDKVIDRIFSMATAAYMSGKKIRLFSNQNSCEIDFAALQDVKF